MAATVIFDENKNQIKVKLGVMQRNYRPVVKRYMINKAKEFESYMKSNHPWKNRTGAAEAGLSASVKGSKLGYVQQIELSHGVPYGVYLEYAMERRYAILEPTMRLKGPEIINGLNGKIGMFVNVRSGI